MANIEEGARYKGMIICVCSFIINTLVMGIMFNFGVMLPTFLDEFNAGRTLTGRLYDNFGKLPFYISILHNLDNLRSQWYNLRYIKTWTNSHTDYAN